MAAATAGPNLSQSTSKLLAEVGGFLPDIEKTIPHREDHTFLHVVKNGVEDQCYTCNGFERVEEWTLYVQIAEYTAMKPMPDDHPVPHMRGKIFKFPTVIAEPDNEIFATFEDIID
jgi:hypothetical protein